MKIKISNGGELQFIYDDKLAPLLAHGRANVKRVSNVEPILGGWNVEMIGDSSHEAVCLQARTFALRSEALAAEVEYLNRTIF